MTEWILADNNIEISREPDGVPVSVLKIVKRRGVKEEDFDDFFSKTPSNTYDPFLIPDLKEACLKVLDYCSRGKSICVYGDYDADGITSTTLMTLLLKHFSSNITYYIPSRFEDGYGPNNDAFKRIKESGTDLLVTVDCGITSKAEIEYAQSIGLDCIVTDHHILRDEMTPDCLVVNPHRPDSSYPFENLSGCGVAFKFAQGILKICEEKGDGRFTNKDLKSFLDLVAISTVADVVPLLDENRLLVKYGLDRINRRDRSGLAVLLKTLDLDKIVDASSISYVIAPNINALGRMGRCDDGVELLSSEKSINELEQIAITITETNKARKDVQEATFQICKNVLESNICGEYAPVIYAPGAHEGVAGIVAGNLKESLNKPVCIVSPSDEGELKGTGRSIQGINLHQIFENCGDVFDRFGGHAGACGFTVKKGHLKEFRDRLQALVKAQVDQNPDILQKKVYIEKELDPQEKSIEFAEAVAKLEPYGEANPVPLFCIYNGVVSEVRHLGAEGQHIKFTIKTNDNIPVSCISFKGSKLYDFVEDGAVVDIAGEIGVNEYKGRKMLQIKIADIKESI